MLDLVSRVVNYPLLSFGHFELTLLAIFNFLLVIVVAYLAASCVRWVVQKRLLAYAKLDSSYQIALLRIIAYSVFIIVFLVGLQTLGIDLTSFTVLAGAIGVGIGFGLQNIVNNFISGMIVLSERKIQVGDRIEVDGVEGFVQSIGSRSCEIVKRDNVLAVIPNAEFISKKVCRWSRGHEYPFSLFVQVPVPYDVDLRHVREILLEIASANPHIVRTPEPNVAITSFEVGYLLVRLNFCTTDQMHKEGSLRTEIYLAVLDAFRSAEIRIPGESMTITLEGQR